MEKKLSKEMDEIMSVELPLSKSRSDLEEYDVFDSEIKEKTFDGPDFRNIDVKREENKAVDQYQKTGDLDILSKIYIDRLPTLKFWSNKNKYLDNNNSDDIRGELTGAFLRAIDKFVYAQEEVVDGKVKIIKRHFNSYLFSALHHDIINISNRSKARKRRPYFGEATEDKLRAKLLSLDYAYGSSDSDGITLRDSIMDGKSGEKGNAIKDVLLKEMLDLMTENEPPYVREFFEEIGMGKKVSALMREYKTVSGNVEIDPEIANRIKKSRRRCTNIVTDLVIEAVPERFKLLDYSVDGCTLNYKIEMHKTRKTDDINKKIRKLRKKKDIYLSKIGIYEKNEAGDNNIVF